MKQILTPEQFEKYQKTAQPRRRPAPAPGTETNAPAAGQPSQ
jgi:hypothetical protein